MKLKFKLLSIFFAISLIPIGITGIIASNIASTSLEEQTFHQLTAIRENKKNQVVNYFDARKEDIVLLSSTIKNLLDNSSVDAINQSAHGKNDYFKKYIETYHYYDLFLISPDGDVFYTVTREADYQSNLATGPYKDSGLGELYKQVLSTKQYSMVDFTRYAPSNNDPASFIGYPLTLANGETLILALQLSIDALNKVMQERAGMGDTGESYLVGSDYLMRSDSYLDKANRSVIASFAGNVSRNGAKTEAVEAGLKGQTDTRIIDDYNDEEVLSAFTPITIEDVRWVLLSEINTSEAFKPVWALYKTLFFVVLLTIGIVVGVSYRTTLSIIRPLGGEPTNMRKLTEMVADGNLTFEFRPRSDGQRHHGVYGAMQKMVDGLKDMVTDIISSSQQLASTAEQTSVTSQETQKSLEAQKNSIEQVATAVEEMSISVQEVAQNALEVADATNKAKSQSGEANQMLGQTMSDITDLGTEINEATDIIRKLAEDSQSISSVMEVIRGIAEQTNLLALNAAIEAARAGEQGRGFAVVADEVRNLAQKTQESTQDIEKVIDKLQSASREAVSAMDDSQHKAQTTIGKAQSTADAIVQVDTNIEAISQMSELIATAAEEQSSVTQEISQSITNINDVADMNTQSAKETANASEQISALAVHLNDISLKFKLD